MTNRIAKLALEDGTVFAGRSYGGDGERAGEVVFNTAMSGYQEILTDPSYKGQIVVMTTAEVGNYGVNEADVESSKAWVEGFVAREFSNVSSNQRATATLDAYLKKSEIPAIDGIDTRALTRKLRITGSMNGVLSTTDLDDGSLVRKARGVPRMTGQDLVKYVARREPAHWKELLPGEPATTGGPKLALIDCGAKLNILRLLVRAGADVTVFPATVKAAELLAFKPAGIVVSNGPGDPSAVGYAVETVKAAADKGVPMLGICLGHQLMGLALGAQVVKLKFGHHGANHPVQNLATKRVEITSQNHGFALTRESLERAGLEVTHVNLNDETVEGFRHAARPLLAVQYHPEASPGPHDSRYLFDEFLRLVGAPKR